MTHPALFDACIHVGNGRSIYVIEHTVYRQRAAALSAVGKIFDTEDLGIIRSFMKNLQSMDYQNYVQIVVETTPLSLEEVVALLNGDDIEPDTDDTEVTPSQETELSITQSSVGTLTVDTLSALPPFEFSGTIIDSTTVVVNATNATMSSFATNEDDVVTTHTIEDVTDIDDLNVEFADVHITPLTEGTVTLDFVIDGKDHKLFTYTAEADTLV